MAVFIDAMIGGELYGEDLVAEQRDYVGADLRMGAEGINTYYGLGLMIVEVDGQWIHGHLGGVDGYTSSVMIRVDGARHRLLRHETHDLPRIYLVDRAEAA